MNHAGRGARRPLPAQTDPQRRSGTNPGALHNNCSGKHAGFVCLGCLMARASGREPAEFVRGYMGPDHPVMREVSAALAEQGLGVAIKIDDGNNARAGSAAAGRKVLTGTAESVFQPDEATPCSSRSCGLAAGFF